MTSEAEFPTAVSVSDAHSIRVLDHDVATELMGKTGFGELAFWLVAQRRPTAAEVRMFEATLVGLTDHGLTPTAIAARVTYYSAPDSLQGAIASGLLGGGSRLLGVTENAGRVLNDAVLREHAEEGWASDDQVSAAALELVRAERAAGRMVPGLGHREHKDGDPRVPVLFALSHELDVYGPHLRLIEAVEEVHEQIIGRRLPLNAAGVSGAVFADLRLPVSMLRGFSLLARTAGLLGHLAEEQHRPLGPLIYGEVDGRARYVAPDW